MCTIRNRREHGYKVKKIIDANELNRKLLDNKELIITAKPFINQLHDFVKGSDFFHYLN